VSLVRYVVETHRDPSGIASAPVNAQADQWDCGCIPASDRACERTGCPVGLEMDQESTGIALVYVCVCEGGVGRLDCGFVLLHSIFYILSSTFCTLSSIFQIEDSIF